MIPSLGKRGKRRGVQKKSPRAKKHHRMKEIDGKKNVRIVNRRTGSARGRRWFGISLFIL